MQNIYHEYLFISATPATNFSAYERVILREGNLTVS